MGKGNKKMRPGIVSGSGGGGGALAPPGVIAAGRLTEWDYKATAGIKIAPNKSLPANVADLPPGATVGTFGPASSVYVKFATNANVSQWDFSGYDVIVDGCTVNATNCLVKFVGGGRAGETTSAGVMNLISCDVDLTGLLSFFHGGLTNPAGCTMTWTDVHAWGAPRIYLDNFGAFTKTRCYVEAFGTNTDPLDHGECIKTDKGSFTDLNSVTDLGDGGPIISGITGVYFWKADLDGDIEVILRDSIYNFSQPLLYTFQAGIVPGRLITFRIGGCAIRRGSSGYFAFDPGIIFIDEGGSFDLVTGNPIAF